MRNVPPGIQRMFLPGGSPLGSPVCLSVVAVMPLAPLTSMFDALSIHYRESRRFIRCG